MRVLPVGKSDIREMLHELVRIQYLEGARGEKSIDFAALEDSIKKLVYIATLHTEIKEIDCNPVIAHLDGISIVDSRIILEKDSNYSKETYR